jgi:hypothetical protein
VTTNLPFSEWSQVIPNPRLCKALIDRLTDQAHIITTGTDSYRFRRTSAQRKAAKSCRKATRHDANPLSRAAARLSRSQTPGVGQNSSAQVGQYSLSRPITKRSEDHPFFQRELAPGSGLIFRSGFMREPCLTYEAAENPSQPQEAAAGFIPRQGPAQRAQHRRNHYRPYQGVLVPPTSQTPFRLQCLHPHHRDRRRLSDQSPSPHLS